MDSFSVPIEQEFLSNETRPLQERGGGFLQKQKPQQKARGFTVSSACDRVYLRRLKLYLQVRITRRYPSTISVASAGSALRLRIAAIPIPINPGSNAGVGIGVAVEEASETLQPKVSMYSPV